MMVLYWGPTKLSGFTLDSFSSRLCSRHTTELCGHEVIKEFYSALQVGSVSPQHSAFHHLNCIQHFYDLLSVYLFQNPRLNCPKYTPFPLFPGTGNPPTCFNPNACFHGNKMLYFQVFCRDGRIQTLISLEMANQSTK